jgi:UDP-N-acetylglucosamine:LPS N-acetylglucosamine transferase
MKLLLVCNSGGHFSTMRSLESFWLLHERVWVSDFKTDTRALQGTEKVYWFPHRSPRNLLGLISSIPATFNILHLERPDLVLSTGASISVSFAIVAKLLGIRFAFVESISRSKKLSLTGQLVYPLCDEFYVQWPALCKKYPKVTFKGYAS